ncbi:hypothetical protein BDW59DRAFT_160761 [Aspergillus cavernicola]|uniref:NAD(P)-binding protein n=1 Tax=Aspergillus cavernicola TaxID=176166 RepID=A0ABR4II07_9EURO
MDSLPGVAVVTGAARGIGAAIATAFVESGCRRLAITDILSSELTNLHQSLLTHFGSLGLTVFSLYGDITSESFIDEFITGAQATFGRIDYLVNVAGVSKPFNRSIDVPSSEFDFINNVNSRAAWLCSRAVLRVMLSQEPLPSPDSEQDTAATTTGPQGSSRWRRPPQRGSIVNVASQLGIVSRPGASAYCASKAAVIGMTRADAIDYSKDLIRVNCVCPGLVSTDMTTSSEGVVNEGLAGSVEIAPMGRMGDVREVADCVLFLSSWRASFVQGHAMVVDGGYVIN